MTQLSILDDDKTDVTVEVDTSDIQIFGWNLLLQPVKIADTTKSGIILPDKFKDDISYLNNVCRVLKVGSLAYTQEMFKGEHWCKEGDFVLIPRNTGQKLLLKGVPVIIIGCDKVIASVTTPEVVDPKFNVATA
jgi:co-chaperonin GroES (HSP10)